MSFIKEEMLKVLFLFIESQRVQFVNFYNLDIVPPILHYGNAANYSEIVEFDKDGILVNWRSEDSVKSSYKKKWEEVEISNIEDILENLDLEFVIPKPLDNENLVDKILEKIDSIYKGTFSYGVFLVKGGKVYIANDNGYDLHKSLHKCNYTILSTLAKALGINTLSEEQTVELVIDKIKKDLEMEDVTALEQMLKQLPMEQMIAYL
jgi:hypothetical protein